MKNFLKIVWEFFEAWGEYRYEQSKKHNYRWY